MSYPPARYLGDGGEVSGAFRRHDHPAELVNASGGGAHYLATGASTRGAFGLYRWDMGPGPGGPAAHFHRTISESFFVLAGRVRLVDGARWVDGVAGDFLYVPEGGIHAFRNESGEPASMLILFAPGAPREDYFETLADAARREAMDDEQRAEFFLRHDTYWV
jgi:mannose-6-phosphate isomerase-like protein (cupin superfamily)